MLVCAAHLTAEEERFETRALQLQQLREEIDRVVAPRRPPICLLGDLNLHKPLESAFITAPYIDVWYIFLQSHITHTALRRNRCMLHLAHIGQLYISLLGAILYAHAHACTLIFFYSYPCCSLLFRATHPSNHARIVILFLLCAGQACALTMKATHGTQK